MTARTERRRLWTRRHGQIGEYVVRVDVHLQKADRSYRLRGWEACEVARIDAEIVVDARSAENDHKDRTGIQAVPCRSRKLVATKCWNAGAGCALLERQGRNALVCLPPNGVRLPVPTVTVADAEMHKRGGQPCCVSIVWTVQERCRHPGNADGIDQREAADSQPRRSPRELGVVAQRSGEGPLSRTTTHRRSALDS
jgi:hypothetical protein